VRHTLTGDLHPAPHRLRHCDKRAPPRPADEKIVPNKPKRQIVNCLASHNAFAPLPLSMSMAGLQSVPCMRHSAFCPRRSARLSCRPAACSRGSARQRGRVPATAAARDADTYYANWLALPIQPGSVRRTQRTTAGPGIFLFEQTQVRSTRLNVEGRAAHSWHRACSRCW
jgi:hypothetical protein